MLLSYEASITANSVLVKNGMRPKMSILDNRYRNFTDEELAVIEHLELNNYTNIEELVHFPNLKSLVIKSSNYNDIIPDVDYRECTAINHIENYEQLSNLSNLEELVIENDLYIENIRNINLASALISIIILQVAMFQAFAPENNLGFANALTGAGVSLIILVLGVLMIIKANRKLKQVNKNIDNEVID